MDEDKAVKVQDKLIDSMLAEEYVPNALEDFETFKKRRRLALNESQEKTIKGVMNGLFLFTVIDSENERTKDLMDKYLNMDKHPIFEKDNDEALAKVTKDRNLFGLNDDDFIRFLTLADVVSEMGKFQESAYMYEALTQLFPTRMESWIRWGTLENKHLFDYKNVLDIYERCLKMFDHPAVYASMGLCHLKGEELPSAEACFKKALEMCTDGEDSELKSDITTLLTSMKPQT